jgi:hypothetical protein
MERWYGATGRRVPAVAMEGSIDVSDALVLDAWSDHAEEAHAAFDRGQPVVIRAHDAQQVKEALAHPEVACVLVEDAELLNLDLVKLTYGH